MDEAGEPFLYGEDGESFVGGGDILDRRDLFYSAGTLGFKQQMANGPSHYDVQIWNGVAWTE